jgi:tripartite-type tricarboxylate transporter receptor subunit TctC
MKVTPRLIKVILTTVILAVTGPTLAQSGQKPLTVIVPFGPGGSTDLLVRIMAANITAQTGQAVVVENRPGAGGYLGGEIAARAPADGSVIVATAYSTLHTGLFVKGQAMVLNKALVPIAGLGQAPNILMMNAAVQARSLSEFIAYAKANPTKTNVGIINGNSVALQTISFLKRNGIDAATVPYNDGTSAVLAVARGDTQFYIGTLSAATAHIEAKRIVPLAMASAERFGVASHIPTTREQGVNFDSGNYYAIMGPAGMSRELIMQIHRKVVAALAPQAAQDAIRKIGFDPAPGTPDQLAAMLAAEVKELTEAAALANVQPQ